MASIAGGIEKTFRQVDKDAYEVGKRWKRKIEPG